MSKNNSAYERHSTHNSQLYEKLLDDEHFLSEEPEESPHRRDELISDEAEQVEMVIEFKQGSNASILVGPEDDPMTLAKRFCFKYNIDPRIISTLATNIRSLQLSTFNTHKHKESNYKIERNQARFDDKENRNERNHHSKEKKTNENTMENTKIRKSRNKTGQSSINDSGLIISNSKSGTTNGASSNRYNVFQRLYQDSRKKQAEATNSKRNQSKSLNNSAVNKSLNESSINNCTFVYEKNTKLKEETRRHNEYLHQLNKMKEVENCKFKPTINPLSSIIATKLRELDESSIMSRSGNDRQMLKIKEYLLNREQQEMKECTFKPKIINKLSSSNTSNSNARFLQLHQDYKHRQAKKRQQSQQKMKEAQKQRQPSINKISKIIVNKDFFERLEQDKAKRITKKQSLEKQKHEESMECRPSTGRPPANRNLGEKTIGEYLYEKAKMAKAHSNENKPKKVTDPNSSKIYQQSKRCAFQYLFELLDNDEDGIVSSRKINIQGLGQEILRLLAPLLSEMEEADVELNQQQFFQALDKLYMTFSIDEKNAILKFYKNKGCYSRVSEAPSFQPALNEKSLMMARQLYGDDVDLYENSVLRMKEKENKLNRLRAERMLVQYNECTFHPNLRY